MSLAIECIQWGLNILCKKKHDDWNIEWLPGSLEGFVLFESKTIHISWPVGQPDYPLMLHEIAHVIVGRGGHDSEFAHEYMRLIRQFFRPNIKHNLNRKIWNE